MPAVCFIQCYFIIQNLTIKIKDIIGWGRVLKSLNVIQNVFVECRFVRGLYCKFPFHLFPSLYFISEIQLALLHGTRFFPSGISLEKLT